MGVDPKAFFGYGIVYGNEFYKNFEFFKENVTGIADWWLSFKEYQDNNSKYPVGYTCIGCEDNPSHFIYIKSTLKTSEWDDTEEIKPEDLIKQSNWDQEIKEVLGKLNLPERSAKFLITSGLS
jgi:hypothetical protein